MKEEKGKRGRSFLFIPFLICGCQGFVNNLVWKEKSESEFKLKVLDLRREEEGEERGRKETQVKGGKGNWDIRNTSFYPRK